MKAQTMDEVCKQPADSYKKFVLKQEDYWNHIEQERKDRMRKKRRDET